MKPLSDFYSRKGSPDGVGYTCKPCSRARAAAWNKSNMDRVLANQRKSWENRSDAVNAKRRERTATEQAYRDRRAAERRRYYANNREHVAALGRARRARPEFKEWLAEYMERSAPRRRAVTIMRKYGIDEESYDALFQSQGGVCAICRREAPLTVDHDHACCEGDSSCGECVRGLLCNPCNRALGFFGDDLKRIRAAAKYLSAPRVAEFKAEANGTAE